MQENIHFVPQFRHKHQDRWSPKERRYWEYTGNGKNNGGTLAEHAPTSISEAMRTFLTFLCSLPEFKSHSKGLGHRQGHRLGLWADREINSHTSYIEETELHLKNRKWPSTHIGSHTRTCTVEREEKLVISLITWLRAWRIRGLLARAKLVRGRKRREWLAADQTSRDGENVERNTTVPALTFSILSRTFASRQASMDQFHCSFILLSVLYAKKKKSSIYMDDMTGD